jgi:hypothetical protein
MTIRYYVINIHELDTAIVVENLSSHALTEAKRHLLARLHDIMAEMSDPVQLIIGRCCRRGT